MMSSTNKQTSEHPSGHPSGPATNTAPQQRPTHISTQDIAKMTPEDVAELAQRLEQDDYNTPFEGLQDWHRLRAVAFQRSELVEQYMHLLDLEAFDES